MSDLGVEIAGVGTTAFGRHIDRSLGELALGAADAATLDAGIDLGDIDFIVFSNASEGVMSGQEMIRAEVALAETGLAGKPMVNVENACASGSSALHVAVALVEAGRQDCVLAVGVEKLFHEDRRRATAALATGTAVRRIPSSASSSTSPMMEMYAAAARRRHGVDPRLIEAMSAVAVKNRRHASKNPNAQFRRMVSADEVLGSRTIAAPLTMLMCSPLSDGASAVVVRAISTSDVGRRVRVAALGSATAMAGASVVRRASESVYRAGDVTPTEIDVWQLHDASAYAEVAQYEQAGLCPTDKGSEWVLDGRTAADGQAPVNTDGGLLSRGHPLGATGLAQVVELTAQLKGVAGWQVAGAHTALAINAGGWIGDDYATCFATLLHVA